MSILKNVTVRIFFAGPDQDGRETFKVHLVDASARRPRPTVEGTIVVHRAEHVVCVVVTQASFFGVTEAQRSTWMFLLHDAFMRHHQFSKPIMPCYSGNVIESIPELLQVTLEAAGTKARALKREVWDHIKESYSAFVAYEWGGDPIPLTRRAA